MYPVLYQDVAFHLSPLVVIVGRAAEAGEGAVIDHRKLLAGHLFPELADEDSGLPGDVVSFQGMAHRLVDQDSAPAVLHHHVHLPRGRVLGLEHGDGFAGAGRGRVLGLELVEHLDPGVPAQSLAAHVRGIVADAEV
jgi:hypothetical protein